MNITNIPLETLIKTYAKTASPNGIFISVLENNQDLADVLGLTENQLLEHLFGYLYLTDFQSTEEMEQFFSTLEQKSHEDNQYAVLVKKGEIIKEYPAYE